MTKAQRIVLMIAVVVAVAMCVFPPWETLGGRYLGHGAIMSPPGHDVSLPDTGRWALPLPDPEARVSFSILVAQFAALWIVSGGVILLLTPKDR